MARIGTAYVEVSGDFSQLRRELSAFRDRGISVNITADIDRSSFARAQAAEKGLGGTESVKLKADVDVSSFARARAVQAVLTKESAKLGDVFSRSQLSIGQWTSILAAASPVILDVAGALGALTASLGAATAGVGALGVGFGGAATVGFGGIAAIAAPAISSLTDLMGAQDAARKSQITGAQGAARAESASAQQIKSAQEQVATATRGVADAEQELESAQESAEIAQESLTAARAEATRQLQDMRRASIEGATSEKRAQLSLQQAQAALRELQRSGTGSALDLQSAELSVVEARQNLRDVTIQSKRDQEDYNKAQKAGIDEMPGVVSAQQSLDSALQGVKDAQAGVADAHRDVAKALENLTFQQKQANMAAGAGGTALAALAQAQRKAGPAAVKLAHGLRDLSRRWRDLTKTGREDFFGLLNDGVTRLNQKLPLLAKSANTSMAALRDGFDDFLKKATGPEFDKFVEVMTRTFAKSIGPISRGFGNIAKVLQRIAVAVAPDIVKMAHSFEGMTQGWVESTRGAGKLRETVHDLVGQTEAWWDLLVAAKDLVVAGLVPGMGQGQKAVRDMTAQLKEWTNWANAHPQEIRDFMKEGLETTRKLADALLSFLPTLFQISQAARPVARAFLGAVKALNSFKIGDWSLLSGIIAAIAAKKVINGILAMRTAVLGVRNAWLGVAAAQTAATAASTAATVGGGGGLIMRGGKLTTVAEAGAAGAGGAAAARGATGGFLARAGSIMTKATAVAAGVTIASEVISGFKRRSEMKSDNFRTAIDASLAGPGKGIPVIGGALQSLSDFAGEHSPFGASKVRELKDALEQVGEVGVTQKRQRFIQSLARETELTDAARESIHKYLLTMRTDTVKGFGDDILGGNKALRGMEKVLRGISTKTPREAVAGLIEKYGDLVTAGHEMSQKQRAAFLNLMQVARRNGDVTQGQLERVTDAFTNNTAKWERSMRRAAQATGQSTAEIKRSVHGMHVEVSKDYNNMVLATGHGIEILTKNTSRAMKALGLRQEIKFQASAPKTIGTHGVQGSHARQRGGPIPVPGSGTGDKVPLHLAGRLAAYVEPHELINVTNRKAAAKWQEWNDKFPRFGGFQRGGIIDRTGVPHLARGGMAAMIAEAGRFERRHFPYVWGGGHSSFGVQPVDCSGAVSDILHAAGLLKAPMVSGDLAHWGKAGRGPLTVYANPEHTFMSLAGKFFGTSSSNPGGGAGWIQGGFDQGYLSGFAARTMDVAGGVMADLKRVILKGPPGPLRDIGQGALDKTWRAGKSLLASKTAGAFGGGQRLKDFSKGPGRVVGASVYGFGEPGTGTVGASGVSLPGKPAFAELDMGTALGGLPFGKKVGIEVGGKEAVGIKLDIGAGGGSVGGKHRAIDFWRDLAEQLGLSGTFLGLAKVKGLQKGGEVAPYIGKFHQGGPVLKDGFGLLQRGEEVVERQRGGQIPLPRGRGDLHREIERLAEVLRGASRHLSTQLSEGQRERQRKLLKIDPEDRTRGQKRRLRHLEELREVHPRLGRGQTKELRGLRREEDLTKGERERKQELEQQQRLHEREHRLREKIEERIASLESRKETDKELIRELSQLRGEYRALNERLAVIHGNSKALMGALSNTVGAQIGSSQHQLGRLASPGSTRSY